MDEPIISVSGMRGIWGVSLTPLIALRYACAFAEGLPAGPIVIAQDGRQTGPVLRDAVCCGLSALGRRCVDVGVAATPSVGILVRSRQAAGGIQISASHNPPQYNGIKLFSAQGRVIPSLEGEEVIRRYRGGGVTWAERDQLGGTEPGGDTVAVHRQLIEELLDVNQIRSAKFRVLVDANHGAGGLLARQLLEELGCEVTLLGEEANGQFAHPPEPTAENLVDVCQRVREAGADIGFCQDPDADRLAIIDRQGTYLGEEYTFAICVDSILRSRVGPIVANCSTSRMARDVAEKYGAPYFQSAVGEANVADMMLAQKAVLGGEGNGGVIDPRVGLVRDSFVGMGLVLQAMASRQMTISELADELPRYSLCKTKLEIAPRNMAAGLDALAGHFSVAKASRLDGLRLDWPDKWLLARVSNTEPIVRVFAEAPAAEEAQRLCREAERVLAQG